MQEVPALQRNEILKKTFVFLIWGLSGTVSENECLPLRGVGLDVYVQSSGDNWENERHTHNTHSEVDLLGPLL